MFNLSRYWYRQSLHPITFCLLPLALSFGTCIAIRRWFYDVGLIKTKRFNVPIIIVGNITVGGTGKTPFVIWLANFLRSQGFKPGIVSRGVGGKKHILPHLVKEHDQPEVVGDEALLLLQNTFCPVCIGVRRPGAVEMLLQNTDCDIVIADDGLQHYPLGRNLEIVMVDSERGFGNQCLLPAGPLREPIKRLKNVDLVIENGNQHAQYSLQLLPNELVSLNQPQQKMKLSDFPHKKVHAVAGIGHPERFFNLLRNAGFELITHPFPDHHPYSSHEVQFADSYPVLMTEKDAVKCKHFANERCWYLTITVKISYELEQQILEKIKNIVQNN